VRTWAIGAVARTLLVAIYHMLKDGTQYKDLGPKHFDRIGGEAVVRGRVSRMKRLGYRGHR
jgi:transposase